MCVIILLPVPPLKSENTLGKKKKVHLHPFSCHIYFHKAFIQ